MNDEENWQPSGHITGRRPEVNGLPVDETVDREVESYIKMMAETLWQDIRYAGRTLWKNPGFALASIMILALGIGAVTTVYNTFNTAVLNPMPFHEPDRLVWIWEVTPAGVNNSVSALDFFDLQERAHVFESVSARYVFQPSVVVTGTEEPDRVSAMIVSAGFFSTLGVLPKLGREFVPDEMEPGSASVAIISHRYWQRRFGGKPDVISTSVTVDGESFEIVGVMPSDFNFPAGIDIWVPLERNAGYAQGRGNNNFFMIARMAEGISMREVEEETTGIMAQIAEENPAVKKDWTMRPQLMHEVFYGNFRPVMLVFMAAVALVLLIACANVSSLFLARATTRQKEVAVRYALGAARWRVVQVVLIEGLLVALLGGALSLLVMLGGIGAIKAFGAGSLPRLQEVSFNSMAVVFTFGVTIITALISGIFPALRGTRFRPVAAMKEAGGAGAGENPRGFHARNVLVVGQVALSLMLLIGAGLLLRSFVQLQREDPGFVVEGLLSMQIQISPVQYNSGELRALFFADLVEQLEAQPNITSAAASDRLPFQGNGPYNGLFRPEYPPETQADLIPANRRMISDGYFRTMGIPVLVGREFESIDMLNSPPVVVINRSMAELCFIDEEAVGNSLVLPWGDGIEMEIVGIVGDVPQAGPGSQIPSMFYIPFRQYPQTNVQLIMRCLGDPAAMTGAVRNIIHDADGNIPIWNESTLEQRFRATFTGQRFTTLLLGLFALIAFILAIIGLYSILSYYVNQRTYEMGIRIALGAAKSQMLWIVLRKGLTLTSIGILIGLMGSLGFTVLLESMLFGTDAIEPITYATVSVILIAVSVLACLMPARRAVRVDPMIALRSE